MTEQYTDPERLDLPSASAMQIIQACEGQPNMKRTLPPEAFASSEQDDEWAAMGTRIHAAFETGNLLPLDPEENRIYQEGVKHEQALVAKWIHDKNLDPTKVSEGPRELRVWLHDPIHFPKLMGSAKLDRHYVYRDAERTCLLVLDLKSGWNPNLPTAAGSWQLKFQVIGLWREEYDNVTDARVAFVKPKGDKISPQDYCDYQMIDLKYSFDALVYHLYMSTQPDAPRRAGHHCRWCPARRGYCPEALAYTLLPSVIAHNVTGPGNVTEGVATVAPADLFKVWRMSSLIRNILDEVTTRLKGFTEAELSELGLKLGDGRKSYPITATRECFEFLRDVKGWPEPDIWHCLEFINGRISQYMELKHSMDKKAAGNWVKETMAQFITIKESAKILKVV